MEYNKNLPLYYRVTLDNGQSKICATFMGVERFVKDNNETDCLIESVQNSNIGYVVVTGRSKNLVNKRVRIL